MIGTDGWIRWHDDGPRQNGASRWERLDAPFALPSTVVASESPPHEPVHFPSENRVTQRYIPRLVPAPSVAALPTSTRATEVILLGDAPCASKLAMEFEALGLMVRRLSQRLPIATLESHFQSLLEESPEASLILALDQPVDLPNDHVSWERVSQELLFLSLIHI